MSTSNKTHTHFLLRNALFCLFTLLGAAAQAAFQMQDGLLTVTTPLLKLESRDGMILSICAYDNKQFCSRPRLLSGKPFTRSLIPDGSSTGTLTILDPNNARLTYQFPGNKKLFYDFKTVGDEILVRAGAKNWDLRKTGSSLDIHVPFLNPEAMITGIGSRTLRQDPPREEQMLYSGGSMYFPRVIIAENSDAVLMFFNESTMPYHDLQMHHTPETDHVILRGADFNLLNVTGKLALNKNGSWLTDYWHISAHRHWVEAARAWQKQFEANTGAVPLWKNSSATVRRIHAVFTGAPNLTWKENPDEYYGKLASEFDPASVILFYWNFPSLITFGDHRYGLKSNPSPAVLAALKKHGFQWIGFHGYSLLCNPDRIATHRQFFPKGHIPKNYRYQPDYDGKPEDFLKIMKPYFSIRNNSVWGRVNPASRIVENYLVRNIRNYAAYHDMAGFYIDITGAVTYDLDPQKKIFDGRTYYEGDAEVFRRVHQESPELLLMSECCGEWIAPYIAYTWEGELAFRNPKIRINHPLRGALYGTYFWSRETAGMDDPLRNAYFGTLPEIVADMGTSATEKHLNSPWHIERAKLFVQEKLFNALPEKWDSDALAYYRSAKNGFFQFRKMPFGYAYTNSRKDVRLGIYQNQTKGLPGFDIPYWCAYDRDGQAIGLNPAREYRFIPRQKSRPALNISRLAPGCHIDSIRLEDSRTTLTLSGNNLRETELDISFTAPPALVLLNGKAVTFKGTSLKLKTALPAVLVSYASKPDVKTPGPYLRWNLGYDDVNGLPASVGFRGYSFNCLLYQGSQSFGGQTKTGVHLGAGRFGSYAEQVLKIPDGAKTLTFFTGMKRKQTGPAMTLNVAADGLSILQTALQDSPEWQKHTVSLEKYAGREILLSFTFRHVRPADVINKNINNFLRIGDIRME